jgi:hypothetical protein
LKPGSWNIYGWKIQLALFGLCACSRLLTTIHHIADPDSLRFALAATDFDLAKLQPHFPGYPVFCFLLQGLTALTGKFSVAFSIIGGLSTFVIIHYLLKLARWAGWNVNPWLIAALVFFNPMIWIMGNRYMPDLMGLALTVAGCALFMKARDNERAAFAFMFIAGLLAGTRLSYLPVLLVPALWSLLKGTQQMRQLLCGAAGVSVWLVPMIIDTGWNDLVAVAATHTDGHFNDWGGTIETEPSYYMRFMVFVQSVIADGLGGYWPGRNAMTIAVSVLKAAGIIAAISNLKKLKKTFADGRSKVLLAGLILYAIWVFLFQNIVYNPRHIMPLVPVLLLVAAEGYTFIAQRKRMLMVAGISLISVNIMITAALVKQHMEPTSIATISSQLRGRCTSNTVIVSTELINYYLNGTGVKCDKISIGSTKEDVSEMTGHFERIITIGNFDLPGLGEPVKSHTYYHNPYVNRIWAGVSMKEYVTNARALNDIRDHSSTCRVAIKQ